MFFGFLAAVIGLIFLVLYIIVMAINFILSSAVGVGILLLGVAVAAIAFIILAIKG